MYGSTDGHSRGASQVTLVDHSTHHSQQDPEEDSRPKDLKAMLKDPSLRAIMGSGALLVFLYSGFDVLFSLSCFTPIEDGGLGLPVRLPTPPIDRLNSLSKIAYQNRLRILHRRVHSDDIPTLHHPFCPTRVRQSPSIQFLHVFIPIRFWDFGVASSYCQDGI